MPDANIIDISHDVDPFNVAQTSYLIEASYASFPKGTVHLIGVDAEINNQNQHIAMQWNDHFFIAADNGILSILTQKITPEKFTPSIFTIDCISRRPTWMYWLLLPPI